MHVTVYGNRAGKNLRLIRNFDNKGFRVYIHIPRGRELAVWIG